jgi:hypothetical protein
MNFALRTILGVLIRLLLLSPFIAGFFYVGEYSNAIDNVATFVLVILGLASVLYLVVMTIIPPEYAIKTDIKVLEFNMWVPQIVAVITMGVVTLGLAVALASQSFYISAVVLFFYALSHFLWPKYAKKIDDASKMHMIEALKS